MQHDIVCNTASLLGADDPAAGGARRGLPDLGWHREPAAGGEDGPRRRTRPGDRPAGRGGGGERARGLHQGGRLLRRRPGARAGGRGLPRPGRRAGRRLHRRHHHGGGLGPDLPPGGDRPDSRHCRAGTGTRHLVPRRRLHGRLPAPLPDRARAPRRAVRLPAAGRDLHVGRRPQVRLRVEGRVGDPVPDARAGPQAAVRDHRLAGRVLRLDGHGRDPAGRAGRRRLGRADAHRASTATSSSPGRRTTPPWRCGPASSPSTASRCGATRRPRCWRSAPATPRPSTSSPSASAWRRRAGTSTGRTGRTRCTPRCTPAAPPPCPYWWPTCGGRWTRSGRARTEQRDTTYGQSV